jgi:hypothetical protein
VKACLQAVSDENPFKYFDEVMRTRRAEADAYFMELQKDIPDQDRRLVQRQALAGMIWSKQFFYYDVSEWLHGDPQQPPAPSQRYVVETSSGSTSIMMMSSPCRTNGSIHGMRRGILHFMRSLSLS